MAAIAYYTNSCPFYNQEGYNRWMSYPPPYWMDGWYYAWPWLWMDGDPDPGYASGAWESYLLQRLPVPSSFDMNLAGAYDPATHAGQLDITIRNDGSAPYTGTLQFVITESGLFYDAPNGVDWHEHVMRDMVPNERGTPVTIQPGEDAVVSQPFAISPTWVEENCELICFIHDNTFQPDSTREVQQAVKVALLELPDPAGVDDVARSGSAILLHANEPNPGSAATEISFTLREAADVRLAIFDVSGREVKTLLAGPQSAGTHTVGWNGVAEDGRPALSGVYFYRLEALGQNCTRQLLITR